MPSQSSPDLVVVGAGHNGLTCGAYLARAGLRVMVVEAGDAIGGGTATRELTLPGFRHNPCANYFHGFGDFPVMYDLELHRYGFEYLLPAVQQAYFYRDGRALVLHRDTAATAKAMSRFSARDARAWEALTERFTTALPLFIASQFNPPARATELAAEARRRGLIRAELGDELSGLTTVRPYDVVDGYFETEQVRVFFKKLIHVIQATNSPKFGSIIPPFLLNLVRNGLARGGTQTLPDALAAIIVEHGGEVRTGSAVTEIIVRQGRAVGTRLDDGTEIESTRGVVAGIDFPQLVELAGPANVPHDVRVKAGEWDWTSGGSLATIHLALEEPPDYYGAEFDPDAARAFNLSFGADTTQELASSMADVVAGKFPGLPVGNGATNTVVDPTYSDGDGHVAFWWPFAPYEIDGDAANWDRNRDDYARRFLEVWSAFASNITEENLLASYLRTPLDVSRENRAMKHGGVRMGPNKPEQSGVHRPHPDLAGYRVPTIEGLYHASSTSPAGGGISGAPGYCAAGVIVEDLGIDQWWNPMTLDYAAELAAR